MEKFKVIITDSLGFEHEMKITFTSKYAAKKYGNNYVSRNDEAVSFRVEKVS